MNLSTDSMPGSDQLSADVVADQMWTVHTWNIIAASHKMEELLADGKPSQFQLEAIRDNGGRAYLLKSAKTAALPAFCEPGILLRPKGAKPVQALNGGKLPAASTAPHTMYWDAFNSFVDQGVAPDLMRLEGEIKLCGKDHFVSLYQVSNALEDGRAFLVLRVAEPGGTSNPDGTAIGNN